ncbi:MAG: hypothetical protein RL414_729 [Actinomycetota bacterium]|jgi:protein SCO1/2
MKKSLVILATVAALTLSGCSLGSSNSHSGMHHNSKDATLPGTAAVGGGSYLDDAIPADVLGLSLIDSDGNTFTLGSLKGKYVVLTNFLTSCQEICPMTTANMRIIANAIADSELQGKAVVLELSVDAKRDTPKRLDAYQSLFGKKSWIMASGTDESLKKIWDYFGAPYTLEEMTPEQQKSLPVDWQTGKPSEYDMMHPDVIIIVGPDSHWKWIALGNPKVGSGGIPEKLKKFLSDDGLNNLAKPQEPTWTIDSVYSALGDLTGVHLK